MLETQNVVEYFVLNSNDSGSDHIDCYLFDSTIQYINNLIFLDSFE